MAVAIAALAVALGGAAFAALPGSNGAIHACYQRNSGDLRIVDAADACRNGETAIAWNQRGPQGLPGGNVVARMRGGPLTTEPAAGFGHLLPLSRDSWTQEPGEFQVLFLDAQTAPPFCPVQLSVYVDGELIDSYNISGAGSPDGVKGEHAVLQLPLFEPETQTTHTLSPRVRSLAFCGPENRPGILDYLKANVVSFR